MRREGGRAEADAGGERRGDGGGQSVDDRRMGGFRGTLVFGVAAATIEMGIILALLYC
jgi:hypothetical protein